MTAREYFENVRACQRAIDRRLVIIESMKAREGVRAQRYDTIGHATGNHDVMCATDIRMDAEQSAISDLTTLLKEVEDGRAVCRGIRAANPCQPWGDVLEFRYIEDKTWTAVANALCISERQAQMLLSCALDWVDAVGIAAAKNGMGQAALAL